MHIDRSFVEIKSAIEYDFKIMRFSPTSSSETLVSDINFNALGCRYS